MRDWEDRALEWRRNSLVWISMVVVVLAAGAGFAGSGEFITEDPLTLATALSPIYPLTRWVEARQKAKLVKQKPVEKSE